MPRRDPPFATAPSIRDIHHACSCNWLPPDYRLPPRRRAWTLPKPNPSCRLTSHGTPTDRQTGEPA